MQHVTDPTSIVDNQRASSLDLILAKYKDEVRSNIITESNEKSDHLISSSGYNYVIQHPTFKTNPNIWKMDIDNFMLEAFTVNLRVQQSSGIRKKWIFVR